jgi:hypothetical protein
MHLSDILTVLSILVAVIALLSEDRREIIFRKFDIWNWVGIVFTIIIIHIVLAFEWFLGHIPALTIFTYDGFPTPGVWAYLFTLCLLIYLFVKIMYGKYPLSNLDKVIAAYQSMLFRNKSDELINAIQKYHLKDLIHYFDEYNRIDRVYPGQSRDRWQSVDHIAEFQKAENLKRSQLKALLNRASFAYAKNVYQSILVNERFIRMVCDNSPSFYAEIIRKLNTDSLANPNLVQTFYKYLIQSNNELLKQELRSIRRRDVGLQYDISDEYPLLHALAGNLDITIHNDAWKAFGDAAIEELKNQLAKPDTILTTEPYLHPDEDPEIWNTATKKAIVFFDIVVREAVAKHRNSRMHCYYLVDILAKLTSPSLRYTPGNIRAYTLVNDIRNMYVVWVTNLLTVHTDTPLTEYILKQLIDIQVILCNNCKDSSTEHISYVFRLLAEIANHEDPSKLHPVLEHYIRLYAERMREIQSESSGKNKEILSATSEAWNSKVKPALNAPRYQPFLSYFEQEVISILKN